MVNRFIVQGRMVRDPELKRTKNGTPCCNFTLAQNNSSKGKDWCLFQNCTAWGKIAENICSSFHKGDSFIVEGHMRTETWTDKNGVERRDNKLTVDVMHYNNVLIGNEINDAVDAGKELVLDREIEDLGW